MKVRGNATYKYVLPKPRCYGDFSVKFSYNMTYMRLQKLIEILLYIQTVWVIV